MKERGNQRKDYGRNCCCSFAQLCPSVCDPVDCSMPGFPSLSSPLLKLMSIESVIPSNHLILCLPLLLLHSIFPGIRVFYSESALCIRWPEYWSFSTSISPANEYSELIPFRIDWLDLFVVQWEKCSCVNDYFCHG